MSKAQQEKAKFKFDFKIAGWEETEMDVFGMKNDQTRRIVTVAKSEEKCSRLLFPKDCHFQSTKFPSFKNSIISLLKLG